MTKENSMAPDSTAVRTALWRALHLLVDPAPHIFEDALGLQLATPPADWRQRPDMDPIFTRQFRASIVGRARFIEDLVLQELGKGLAQYVILGAGLDTFAQRRPEIASRIRVFEVDQAEPQAWKKQRLLDLGFGIPDWLRFVPMNFEAGEAWWDALSKSGFDSSRPSVFASTGVSMYLSKEANQGTLEKIARFVPGTCLAMTFILPLEATDPELRPGLERAVAGAKASGTPFVSFFMPEELVALARGAGFKDVQHISALELTRRYFEGRSDGLQPPRNSEEFILARL